MSGALAYRPDASEAALLFQIKPGSYNTDSLIEFLTDLHAEFGADKITLIWDHLPAHKSKAMTAWLATQRGWLVVERLPGYPHDINPIEMVWGKTSRPSSWPTCAWTPSRRHAPPPSPGWSVPAPATSCASPSSPTPACLCEQRSPNYRNVFKSPRSLDTRIRVRLYTATPTEGWSPMSSSRRRVASALALTPVLAVSVAACGSSAGNNAASSGSGGSGNSKGDVLIGEVVGATGAYGIIGVNMENASKMAVAKINSQGGILGRHVTLQYADDQGNPTLGSQLFQKFVSAGADAIVGSGDTGPATAAEAEKLQVPDIGIVDGGGPTVYPNGPGTAPLPWVFEYSTSTYELGDKLASYALQHCKKTAVLHDQTSYGEGANQAISYAFKKAGKSLVVDDTITENWSSAATSDITPEVHRVQASGADCVVPWLTPEDAARYVSTAASLGVKDTVLANDDAYGDNTYPKLAGSAADGSISAELDALVHPNAALLAYQKQYKSQFGATADIYGEQTYDAIMMWAKAAEQAHSVSPKATSDALNHMSGYQGITGTLGFSPTDHEDAVPSDFVYIKYDGAKGAWVPLNGS